MSDPDAVPPADRAILTALAANVGHAIAKLVGFFFTGSASMLAEAVHSLADTTNQALLLVGRKRAMRPESRAHPFGYGAERFLWSFLVSVMMLVGGAFVAIYKGVQAVIDPSPIAHPGWAIGILAVALFLDGGSLFVASKSARRRGREGWFDYIRRSKRPEVPIIILEDATAVLGVLVALAAVVLTVVTGNPVWDGLGSVLIGVLLGVMAIVLARETMSLLIGEAASPEDEDAIRTAILADDAIRELVYLRTLHVGPDELFVEVKARMDPRMSVRDVALAIDRIEVSIRRVAPEARIISIEPDVPRADDPDVPRFEDVGGPVR